MIGEDERDSNEKLLRRLDETLATRDWRSIFYLRRLFERSEGKMKETKEIERVMEKHKISLTCTKKWKRDLVKLQEGYLLYMLPLGFYLYGTEEKHSNENIEDIPENRKWSHEKLDKLDDYVYDKHTLHAINRTTEFFVKETSKVIPEVFRVPMEFKKIYEWARCGKKPIENTENIQVQEDRQENPVNVHQEVQDVQRENQVNPVKENQENIQENRDIRDIEKESEMSFVVRIQLTTSNQKQDTYYAEYNGVLYFIKGPFQDRKTVDDFIQIQEIKKERGIPYMENVYCVMLYPDRWDPKEIPIGYRRFVDVNKKYPFMIAKSLIPKDKLVTRIHSSKCWPPTEVLDDKTTKGARIKITDLERERMIDFLNVIALRIEYNIGDIAERNFMIISNRVLSVDEEFTSSKVSLLDCVKKSNYDFIKTTYREYRNKLLTKSIHQLDKEFYGI